MHPIRSARAPLAILAATALLAAACTASAVEPERSPGEIEGELVSTDDVVPPELPPGFPLPGDPTVLYSAVSELGLSIYLSTGLEHDRIVTALVEALPSAGWTIHSCNRAGSGADAQTRITASAGRKVASIQVGYSEESAARIDGATFSYLVSMANNAPEPITMETLDC